MVSTRVFVDRVLSVDELRTLVAIRCLSGEVSVGSLLSYSVSSDDATGPAWRVVEMRRYGQVVDLIDPPHSGVLSLIGDRPGGLVEGVELIQG